MFSLADGAIAIVSFAIIIQVLLDRIKPVIPAKVNVQWVSMVLGIMIAVAFRVDVFAVFGAKDYPLILAYILSGVLISGGAGFVNDMFKLLQGAKDTRRIDNEAKVTEPVEKVVLVEKPQPVVEHEVILEEDVVVENKEEVKEEKSIVKEIKESKLL